MNRRGFLLGLLAAPVIVKASSLMAVKPVYVGEGLRISLAMETDLDTTALRFKATERYAMGWHWNLADHPIGPLAILPNTPAQSPEAVRSQLSRVLQDYPQAVRLTDLLKRSETPDRS